MSLSAGDYWVGFINSNMQTQAFSTGNNSLIDTTPSTGTYLFTLTSLAGDSGNSGFILYGDSVPEPATAALLGLGALGAGALARRRARGIG